MFKITINIFLFIIFINLVIIKINAEKDSLKFFSDFLDAENEKQEKKTFKQLI